MDFNSDHSPAILNRGYSFASIPNYVNLADKAPTKIASVMWADPVRHEFPVDTASNTFKSAAYAIADKGLNHPALKRIKEACVYHDIEDDFKKLVEGYESETKSAATEVSVYALHLALDSTKSASVGLYPINNYNEVVESARCLMQDRNNLDPISFKQACLAVVEQAQVHDVPLSRLHQELVMQGTPRLLNEKIAANIIERRCEAHPEHAGIYRETLASAISDPMMAKEAAAIVIDLDESVGYIPGRYEVDPVSAFCSGTTVAEVKQASEANVLWRDVMIPISDLRKVDGVKLAGYMDKKMADDLAYVCQNGNSIEISEMLGNSHKDILMALDECSR